MKILTFNLRERIQLSDLLSLKPQGNRLDMVQIYNMLREIEITPREIEENGISQEGNAFFIQTESEKKVTLSNRQVEILSECIDIADNNGEINIQMVPLIEKIDQCRL